MNFFARCLSSIRRVLGRPWFFKVILGLFAVQAVWIALSGRYPMAFDEDFHLGIIKLYAHHLSPIWSSTPPGSGTFGAVTRDPSYLFQYLMSFPYRLFSLFTHSQTVIVLLLRAIDIALFGLGLVLYRKVLLKTGASRAMAHGVLLVFILLPIVPLLAAQINYDNLVLPLLAWALLLTMDVHTRLRNKQLPLRHILLLLTVCLFASLVKYAFLPLAAGIFLYLLWDVLRLRRDKLLTKASLRNAAVAIPKRTAVVLSILLVVGLGLFVERYGVNVVRYHTPIPDCGQVLSVSECSAYGPWIRDYNYAADKSDAASANPVVYSGKWLYGMWLRTFFAVDGPGTGFDTKGPLAVPAVAAVGVAAIALTSLAFKAKAIKRRYPNSFLGLFFITTAVYVVSLWLEEYKDYLHTGQPVAINGRYLLLVAPMIMLAGAFGVSEMLRRRPQLKTAFAGVTILALLWGGGALTYILRSTDQWYWPNSTVRSINHAVQRTIGPITPGDKKPQLYLH